MDPAENDEQREMVSELERQAIAQVLHVRLLTPPLFLSVRSDNSSSAQMEALETAASSLFYKSSRNLHTPSGGTYASFASCLQLA